MGRERTQGEIEAGKERNERECLCRNIYAAEEIFACGSRIFFSFNQCISRLGGSALVCQLSKF